MHLRSIAGRGGGAAVLGAIALLLAEGGCASCKGARGSGGGAGVIGAAGGAGVVPGDSKTDGGAGGDGGGSGRDDGGLLAAGARWIGRVDISDADHPRFAWSGTGFVVRFNGVGLSVSLRNAGPFVFKPIIDGLPQPAFAATTGTATTVVASGLAPGEHTVGLYRQTEGVFGESQLVELTIEGGALLDPPRAPARRIDVFGASVSCGYGDLGASPCGFSFATESHFDTYAAVAARLAGAELTVVAISGRGVYRNSDGSTEGTIPLLADRVLPASATPAWDFRPVVQAVVINLGKNDLATGDPGQPFVDAYADFARTLRARYPDALIVAATGPNLGATAHALQLAAVNAALARRSAEGDDRIALLDWPEELPSEEGCDVHPNAVKHRAMGEALALLLRDRLGW